MKHEVVEHRGRGLFRHTCEVCGRRSGLFTVKASRDESARTHTAKRCPGYWSPNGEPPT